jgi:hypothetical protein
MSMYSRVLVVSWLLCLGPNLSSISTAGSFLRADTHIHLKGCEGNASATDLVQMLIAENLDIAAGLSWGASWDVGSLSLTGEDSRASVPGHVLHYDLEISAFPAAQMGHLTLLGVESPHFSPTPFSSPRSNLPIIRWATTHNPRVLIGMSHGQAWPSDGTFPPWASSCCTPFEYPIEVALGISNFLEIEPALNWGPADRLPDELPFLWKSLLNTGFRIPLTGASDYPCLSDRPGTARTYVLTEGKVSYSAMLEGIRQGRTVLAIGHLDWLNVRINGAQIGEEAWVKGGTALEVTLESNLAQSEEVVLYANGSPLATVRMHPGPQVVSAQVMLGTSAWISARSTTVLTSPIYVLVDGTPVRPSAESACYFIRYVDYLLTNVTSRDMLGDKEKEEVHGSYRAARREFERRFHEGGGETCS